MARGAQALIVRMRRRLIPGAGPLFVGIDGRSGTGKSTLAAAVSKGFAEMGDGGLVTVIEGDQFYAGGSAATWDRRSATDKVDRVIDWRRQREVLEQLRVHGVAEWHPFDWDAEDWDGDTVPLARVPLVARATPVVILEGAYSCRPELHDLLELRVLVDIPRDVRRRQLLEREGHAYRADWEARWSDAEDHYFGTVMPPARFDLVIGSP
jgi:uridine kinase